MEEAFKCKPFHKRFGIFTQTLSYFPSNCGKRPRRSNTKRGTHD
ncbi:hypothetical protein CLOSTMETH_00027 [[Clostridium] methylpentosum DSM 5476]|uniref:Uncharacterized protein n=1 Tax=[Clostridium] methylpentosum DSM 5476 TaxID=537013 RepID=C0E8C4_9FIRM|nr:hypothetical protein CLOSTMETH_00027 [[Clostridium] methylpentosum DSM 5476]